jgi:tetratricopeptide (TPR) repeat protein
VRWGHIELTIKLLNESIKTLEGTSKAVAMMNMATVYWMVGDPHTALRYYAEAEQTIAPLAAKDESAKNNLAGLYHQIGIVHQGQGNLGEAQARYAQALEIFGELGDKKGIALALSQMGTFHQQQGNYQEAQKKQEQSLAIRREIGDKKGTAICLHQLGTIHHEQGNLEEAQAGYEQSLAIKVELGDKRGIALSLGQLGVIHHEQGNLGEAQAKYEQVLGNSGNWAIS